MSKRKRGKRRRGHFCWACNSYRPNEKFSGRGHARHICRACQKLGADELSYRQARRNLESCVTWDGFIRRKRRKVFETFLQHPNPRVRRFAEELQRDDAEARLEEQLQRDHDEARLAELYANFDSMELELESDAGAREDDRWDPDDSAIPF